MFASSWYSGHSAWSVVMVFDTVLTDEGHLR